MWTDSVTAIGASIGFLPDVYQTVEVLANERKVSLASAVRAAAEKYIDGNGPLLSGVTGE